jgi:nitrilase
VLVSVTPMLKLARFKAAAVQASPVFLDARATVDKAVSLIREAAKNAAKIVAFPEVFVPGYPYWNWITDPVTGGAWFERLVKASVLVPGPEIDAIRRAARDTETYVVIGVNERSPVSLGALYTRWSSSRPTVRCSEGIASWSRPGRKN